MAGVGAQLEQAITAAARFGADPAGGVTRTAWSGELLALYGELTERGEELGLSSLVDEAGNLILRWQSGAGPALAVGSHLDTVPNGGRFDGALGVLAGLEAIRRLRDEGFEPAQPIWLIAFMDEEGARFGTSLFGSRAFVGMPLADLGERVDADGVTLREAMDGAGFDLDVVGLASRVGELGGYLELHIEQGPVLEQGGLDLGIVTGISGVLGLRVRLIGEAGHAGTVPMDARRDALVGGARLVLAVDDLARATGGLRATVGVLDVRAAAANVIPGEVEISIDLRAGAAEMLDEASRRTRQVAAEVAEDLRLGVEVEQTHRADPVELDPVLTEALEAAAAAGGARSCRLLSGAGHDAMVLAPHVPAAMLFVPSVGGVSHRPDECSSAADCEAGATALVEAIRSLDGRRRDRGEEG